MDGLAFLFFFGIFLESWRKLSKEVEVFFSDSHRISIPWLMVIAFAFLDQLYAIRFLQNGLLENGIFSGNLLIEWDRVQSYKWVIPRKKKDYSSIKIKYSKYYSFHIAYLIVPDDQKGEADELFKKMVRVVRKGH